MKFIIAIDPGQNGGIAVHHNGKTAVEKMCETDGEIISHLESIDTCATLDRCEKIAYVEAQSGFGGHAASMFTFGEHYGLLKTALRMLGWRLELVRPQAWQKALGLGHKEKLSDKNAASRQWKNKLRDTAARLYPSIDVKLWGADALLILEYARKQP